MYRGTEDEGFDGPCFMKNSLGIITTKGHEIDETVHRISGSFRNWRRAFSGEESVQ